jgi:hypothetical protein
MSRYHDHVGVVDRHRFDAYLDPDPNFHGDADPDPDPDPDWHQNDAEPHADPTLVGKLEFFVLLVTAFPVNNVLSFSSVSNVSLFFSILASTFKFSLLGIDTNPDRGSDPIRIRIHNIESYNGSCVSGPYGFLQYQSSSRYLIVYLDPKHCHLYTACNTYY